jgi:hypothetical protein
VRSISAALEELEPERLFIADKRSTAGGPAAPPLRFARRVGLAIEFLAEDRRELRRGGCRVRLGGATCPSRLGRG